MPLFFWKNNHLKEERIFPLHWSDVSGFVICENEQAKQLRIHQSCIITVNTPEEIAEAKKKALEAARKLEPGMESNFDNNQLLSYIAHSVKAPKEMLLLQKEMTDRAFPCIRSSEFDEHFTSPKELSEARLSTLGSPLNRFFFFFIDYSKEDPIALAELGYALAQTEHVCLIGRTRTNSFMHHSSIQYFDSIENFLSDHFVA